MTFKISSQQSLAWPFTEHGTQLLAGLCSPSRPPGIVMGLVSPGLRGGVPRKVRGLPTPAALPPSLSAALPPITFITFHLGDFTYNVVVRKYWSVSLATNFLNTRFFGF